MGKELATFNVSNRDREGVGSLFVGPKDIAERGTFTCAPAMKREHLPLPQLPQCCPHLFNKSDADICFQLKQHIHIKRERRK